MPVSSDRKLRARIRRMPDGMFKAEYPGELNPVDADARQFPDQHLGTEAAEVKAWVEIMAKGMGYTSVVWEADAS